VFDHVTIRVSERDASRRFYETVLAALGHELTVSGGQLDEWNDFGLAQARNDRPVTRRLHVAFVAGSREEVDACWRAAIDAGYASDGEPGLRPQYHEQYYGGFLLDPDR
jgi:catechol 2,3-dioxygenase-like lactoylglutathione lyase family enzyme